MNGVKRQLSVFVLLFTNKQCKIDLTYTMLEKVQVKVCVCVSGCPSVPPGSRATAASMQSTTNYLWLISDLLGQGATANVYRGRHKVRPPLSSGQVTPHSQSLGRGFSQGMRVDCKLRFLSKEPHISHRSH